MNIKISKNQLNILENKNKLHTFLSGVLTKAYFKVEKDKFTFVLRSPNGMLKTYLPIESNDKDEVIYYSVPYAKWSNALQKFSNYEYLNLSFKNSILKIGTDTSSDVINLGITVYESDSSEANAIDSFIDMKSKEIINENKEIELEPNLLLNFQFADSLFSSQAKVNSIGLGRDSVMYSDKSVILKAYLKNPEDRILYPFSDDIFNNVDTEDGHIYIHTRFLKLFNLISGFNPTVNFSDDYGQIYWRDTDTELVLISETPIVGLPNDEQFEGIKPSSRDSYITVTSGNFLDGVSFFDGFYEGEDWKPVTFTVKGNKGVTLSYEHPTANLSKELNCTESFGKGTFKLPSEILKSIFIKVKEKFGDPNTPIRMYFDEDSLGAYFEVKNSEDEIYYEIMVSYMGD